MKSTYVIALLYSLLFARVSGRFEALTRLKHFKTAWDADKQQRIQKGNKISRLF